MRSWQLSHASTCCDRVRMLLRITGLTLLTAVWLPVNLFGNSFLCNPSINERAGDRTSIETAFTSQSPVAAEQIRQPRPSSSQSCNSKGSGPDFAEFSTGSKRIAFGSPENPSVSAAPSELRQTWQFTRRTALQPRAPCRAWLSPLPLSSPSDCLT